MFFLISFSFSLYFHPVTSLFTPLTATYLRLEPEPDERLELLLPELADEREEPEEELPDLLDERLTVDECEEAVLE